MYLLTGSQAYELMKEVSQSLSGRVSIIRMSPLSTRKIFNSREEIFSFDPLENAKRSKDFEISADELYELIVKGIYPELYDNPSKDVSSFYSDYVDTYIEKVVFQIIKLKDKLKFLNFMEVLASLTCQKLTYDTLAKAIGVKVIPSNRG